MIDRARSTTQTRSGGPALWLAKLQRHWDGELQDERQETVWNQAATQTLYLMVAALLVASLSFQLIDAKRYGPCADVLLAIALGGLIVTRRLARRQGVRPVTAAVTWPAMILGSLLFGLLFYVTIARTDGLSGAVASGIVAVIWGLAVKFTLDYRRQADLQRARELELQADEETDHHLPT
jgi:hypothetical protein